MIIKTRPNKEKKRGDAQQSIKARTKEIKKTEQLNQLEELEKFNAKRKKDTLSSGDLSSRTKDSESSALPTNLPQSWNHSGDFNT